MLDRRKRPDGQRDPFSQTTGTDGKKRASGVMGEFFSHGGSREGPRDGSVYPERI